MKADCEDFDCIVVGGGPAGATAATDLAVMGHRVLLLDKAGRIKPCGGAVPPRLMRDFDIPSHLLVAEVNAACIVSPAARRVDMPIDSNGYVGMVDREHFDSWLRDRAETSGAARQSGTFVSLKRNDRGHPIISYTTSGGETCSATAKCVIGADGALSAIARQELPDCKSKFVFAYHEIVRAPVEQSTGVAKTATKLFDSKRCDVYYDGRLSPDFYGWVFPHGATVSVGTGSANKGFSLRKAVGDLRRLSGLDGMETLRREGAPIPLKPLKRWDNGRDVVVAGDAAGVVAPASGEGIYYAMYSGRLAAQATAAFLATGDARKLAMARKQFMQAHRNVFFVLGVMQHFWYRNDARRERFVSMCADKDVQSLTWQSYMHKELKRTKPIAHLKIFFKDLAHLAGVVPP
jgi:geranylgeranyl diphosphate/geranylgeranyl-bacteriochlorophyllide a reductase